jgi:hypothetical protein
MTRFSGMTPARRARVVGVLAIVPAAVLASGLFVATSLAAARHPAPLIASGPAHPHADSGPGRPLCLHVHVTDRAGHAGPIASSCWTIGTVAQNFTDAQNFTVGGNLTAPLYPGTSQPLNLTFTNPSSWPLTIPRGGVSASDITIASHARGCASSNFAVTQGLASAVTIRARQLAPASLSALGVPRRDWPLIEMIETNTNQDACQGAKLTLTYSGIEASR